MSKRVIVVILLMISVAAVTLIAVRQQHSADQKRFWAFVDEIETRANSNSYETWGDVLGDLQGLTNSYDCLPADKQGGVSRAIEVCRNDISGKTKSESSVYAIQSVYNDALRKLCAEIKRHK